VAYSPDGRRLVAGFSGSRSLVTWDAAGKREAEFDDAAYQTFALAFAPDGRTVATGNEKFTARLWEADTGKERRLLRGHRGPVAALAFSADGRLLATASEDHTVLVWDRAAAPGAAALTAERLQQLWVDLAGPDARRAYDAVCAMAAAPERAVELFGRRLEVLPRHTPEQVRRLIAALDANSFKRREQAMEELTLLGRFAEEPLREALKGRPTLEARRRIEALLQRMGPAGSAPDSWVRLSRAVEVLEQVGGDGARQLLEKIAAGADAPATRQARAALERLDRRGRTKP
jgi:hypothetical protein